MTEGSGPGVSYDASQLHMRWNATKPARLKHIWRTQRPATTCAHFFL